MGNVMLHVTMSLDGYIAGPNDDVNWTFSYGTDEMAHQVMGEVGAVVIGNRGFREGTMNEDALPYGGLPVPQFVVTHEAREPLTLGGLTFTFVTGGIERAVSLAREAAGEKKVALLGASIDQQCLTAGLVDELVLHICPVLLNSGVRLFEHVGASPIQLERTAVTATGKITSLRFRVMK